MVESKLIIGAKAMLLAGLLAVVVSTALVRAQDPSPGAAPAAPQTPAPARQTASAGAPSHYQPNRFPKRAGLYYENYWGIDSLRVKSVESGEIIRFTYRVLDPGKASVLNDKKFEPALIAPRAGVKLVVPSLEKVGQLRQTATPAEGKAYWMAFSNKGRPVKRGDHVNVVIGAFHADGLVVE